MTYFGNLPKIEYCGQLLEDLIFNFQIRPEYINELSLGKDYIVRDYDTPETIALSVWGDQNDGWIIMKYNKIFDIVTDWPLASIELEDYAKILTEQEYGSDYTEEQLGLVFSKVYVENEFKRRIRLPIDPVKEKIKAEARDYFTRRKAVSQ